MANNNNLGASDEPARCECCGAPEPRTDDGYTECCNEPLVHPGEWRYEEVAVAYAARQLKC